MAKIFKPRRALRSSVKSGSKRTLVLASGELMCVGKTAIGENSKADIYLGDGVSQIQNLQPALFGDTSEEDMTITDDTSSTATAALGNVTTGATLGSILGSLKRAISLNASAIATLNDDFVQYPVARVNYTKHTESNLYISSLYNGMVVGYTYIAYSNGYIFHFADSTYSRVLSSSGTAISIGVDNQGIIHITNTSMILYWLTFICTDKFKLKTTNP
jgi:hypothetical protein